MLSPLAGGIKDIYAKDRVHLEFWARGSIRLLFQFIFCKHDFKNQLEEILCQ